MRILIDADGCPVISEALHIAATHRMEAVLFCDTSHEFAKYNTTVLTVSKGADSADFALVNQIEPGDIVITQDYGLAAMALARGGRPITQNGKYITDGNLLSLLESRHAGKKARRAGVRSKGPAKRTTDQNRLFTESLERLVHAYENTDCPGQL